MKGSALPLVLAIFLLSVLSVKAQTNNPPVAQSDSYTVHGATTVGSYLANDYDPDGDSLQDGGIVSYPAHGTLSGVSPGYERYTPNYGFAGSDSFTYSVCDGRGGCASGVVTITVNNGAPQATGESFVVRGYTVLAPLLRNDSDPDGDPVRLGDAQTTEFARYPAHGTLYGVSAPDVEAYQPNYGYVGPDSFAYNVCDGLGKCTQASVSLFVFAADGLENAGPAACNANVGEPVNVTNGNMYLTQPDYRLPGAGEGIQVVRTYNSNSQRVGLFGRGWTTAYDEAIQVYDSSNLRLLLESGQAVYFTGTGGTFAPAQTDFVGSVVKNADNTYTLTLKDGATHRFSSAGKLLSLTDRNGNQTVLAYNANNKLASITDPGGRVLTVTADSIYGYVTALRDTVGTIATYSYGSGAVLTSVVYPDGSKYQFSYVSTANGQVISQVTDALNNVLEAHTYDAQGRSITSEKQGGVERVTLAYVSSTETDVTDALNRVTKYFFDQSKGRYVVTRIEGSCGCGGGTVAQTFTYDDLSRIRSRTNGLGQTTSFTYDLSGNPLTIADARGTITYTYNARGEVLTAADSVGTLVTNTYNAQGNLLTTKDALNNTTTFAYTARGQLQSVTDARAKVTSFAYDTGGNLTQKTDAAGGVFGYAYDARGRLSSATDALNHVTSFAYDPAGRLNKVTAPDGTFVTYTYDLAGRRTRFTDARGNATNYGYDSAYRLTGVTNADNKTTAYGFDLMSNLTARTDALGRTTNYEYDNFNRPTKVIYPPAAAGAARLNEQIAYDAGGRVTSRTDRAGRVTSYDYDGGNRLIKVTDPALKPTQYEYNSRSYLTALIDALNQRTTVTPDALGRVTQVSRNGLAEHSPTMRRGTAPRGLTITARPRPTLTTTSTA